MHKLTAAKKILSEREDPTIFFPRRSTSLAEGMAIAAKGGVNSWDSATAPHICIELDRALHDSA